MAKSLPHTCHKQPLSKFMKYALSDDPFTQFYDDTHYEHCYKKKLERCEIFYLLDIK